MAPRHVREVGVMDLATTLQEHLLWLHDKGGKRADLSDADLRCANLYDANLSGACLDSHYVVPSTGNFFAWKKCANGVIVKVLVPATSARVCYVGSRKCRVEYCVPVESSDGSIDIPSACVGDATPLTYTIGQVVYPDSYDDDERVECSHGIHMFMTEREAREF